MSESELFNVIIMAVQSVILVAQFLLSRKIYNSDVSKEKGYFVIEETNYRHPDKEHFRNIFVFETKTYIGFHLTGETDVLVKGVEVTVNDERREKSFSEDILYTLDERFNTCLQEISIMDEDLQRDKMDIIVLFYLENNRGYKYSECVPMQFIKKGDTFWELNKYNMIIRQQSASEHMRKNLKSALNILIKKIKKY